MARDGNAKGMKETKFKDTELGKIPEEWEVCNLGSIGVPLMCKRIMKWQTAIVGGAINEAWRVTYGIEEQITALVSRYERRLTDIEQSVGDLEKRVNAHLAKMGF